MADWKELWLSNYKGVGDTADLEKHLKTLGYGARNNISYLPWAVVERIFRLQGGDVHWLPSQENHTFVDVDSVELDKQVNVETGETSSRFIRSYFINIQAIWQGREYVERYPLQDSNGRPLSNWTQNELNKAYQRGKVKAIAIVSGIGYKLFEDGDLQFDQPQEEEVVVKKQKKVDIVSIPKQEEDAFDPSRLELEQELKKIYLSGDSKATEIKKFLVDHEVKKLTELSDEQIKELHALVK